MTVGTATRIAYHESPAFSGAKEAAAPWISSLQDAKTVAYASIHDVVVAVKKENAQLAIVPVESSTTGSCHDTYDLLLQYNLSVVGECKHSSGPGESSSRFWVVSKASTEPSPKVEACKTSLVFAFASGNGHGQLHRALGVFASRGLDLTKVESRPWRSSDPSAGKAEFLFYVDVKARQNDVDAMKAVAALRAMCVYVRVLGCYPSDELTAKSDVPLVSGQDMTMAQKYPMSPVFESTTIAKTLAIFEMTQHMAAEGKPVYSLCVGEPDFPPPKSVLEAGIKAIEERKIKYADMRGMAKLRELIVEYLHLTKGVRYDAGTEVQVCSGAQQALFNVILAICRPGDKVLLPTPAWANYEGVVTQVKADLIFLRNKLEEDYLINPAELEKTLTANPETKILILCNPSNPAGTLHSPEQLEQIAAVLRKPQFQHVVVISDEIYEQLVYQDEGVPKRECQNFATVPGMFERTILINGFSKAYALTGMRLGYACGPKHFMQPVQLIQGQTTSCASSVSQIMGIEALRLELEMVERGEVRIAEDLHGLDLKRQYVVKRLRAMPNVRFAYPTSAFYIFIDLALLFEGKKAFTADKEVLHDVDDFCMYLIRTTGVAVGPGSDYGEPHGLRIAYAGSMDTMVHAMDGFESALNSLTFE